MSLHRVYLKTVNTPKQRVFFRLLCAIFPCNTQSIPAEEWLHQSKNPSLLVIFPVSDRPWGDYGRDIRSFIWRF